MKKVFVLPMATALSLGYAAGFATNDIVAQAGVEDIKTYQAGAVLTNGQQSVFDKIVETSLCPEINKGLKLDGADACTPDDIKAGSWTRNKDMDEDGKPDIVITGRAVKTGIWVAGKAE